MDEDRLNSKKLQNNNNVTCITLIYAALHYVTLPNMAEMIHKTSITPDSPT